MVELTVPSPCIPQQAAAGPTPGNISTVARQGVANFTGVNLDQSGEGFVLEFSADGLAASVPAFAVEGSRVQVVKGAPATVKSGFFIENITVRSVDVFGNPALARDQADMRLAIGSNPNAGTISVQAKGLATANASLWLQMDVGYGNEL
jgi:hypothetical protein